MFVCKNRYSILFRTIALLLVCLFCANSVLLADSSTLAPLVGNPKVYQEMRKMMEERLATHQDTIDEFIKQHASKAKSLSQIPGLKDKFMQCIKDCNAENMFSRLETTLAYQGGSIQVIFLDKDENPPKFEGKDVWGHAGTYITVFARKDDDKKEMLARLFHEIRARSKRAKELFDEEFDKERPVTQEQIDAFTKRLQEKFESDNLEIENQIKIAGNIKEPILRQEFTNLTFATHPDVMNRDYAMAQIPQESEDANSKKMFIQSDLPRFKQLLLAKTPTLTDYEQAKVLWKLKPELTRYRADGATCELGHAIKWEMVIAREDGTRITLGPDDVVGLGFARTTEVKEIQTSKRKEINQYRAKLLLLSKYQDCLIQDGITADTLTMLLSRLEHRDKIGDEQFEEIGRLFRILEEI